MFKAKTLQDFKQLQKAIDHLNEKEIWKLRLEVKQDYSECDLYVIDETEELYYGGIQFEHTMSVLEHNLKVDTGDDEAYFDCICPGRWLADFKGRSRYTEDDMKSDIHLAISKALLKYTEDNGKELDWSNDENTNYFDALPDLIVHVLNKIIK